MYQIENIVYSFFGNSILIVFFYFLPKILVSKFRKRENVALGKSQQTLIYLIILSIIIIIEFGYLSLHAHHWSFLPMIVYFVIFAFPALIGIENSFSKGTPEYILNRLIEIEKERLELCEKLRNYDTKESDKALESFYKFSKIISNRYP